MSYSLTGLIAIAIHLILNRNALKKHSLHNNIPGRDEYRLFLLSVLGFYVTDSLWGILADLRIIPLVYLDTVLYFIIMMLTVLMWTRFVTAYLEVQGRIAKILYYTGISFLLFEVFALIINFFIPILFGFDENGDYHAGELRYISFSVQILLFLMTAAYTLYIAHGAGEEKRKRYRTIGFFGIAMTALIVIQLFYPLLPMYATGYLIGICLIYSFVVEDEREDDHRKLEEIIKREREREQELGSAMEMVYTDPMTGARSKQAYLEEETNLDRRIKDGTLTHLGIVVFDLNDLKTINDTLGHETGNIYIYKAFVLISEFFTNSPVYRIGGDEFVVILQGEDYRYRETLIASFNHQIDENKKTGQVVISSGMAILIPNKDTSFSSVFERADHKMYMRKKALKAK